MSDLVLAAASLHAEKWRFTYGRKLTPSRIASFRMPTSTSLREWVVEKLHDIKEVVAASLRPYQTEDERNIEIAHLLTPPSALSST